MDIDKILRLSDLFLRGGLAPKGAARPEHIAVRIIAGHAVGLDPVASINSVAIVNGRATLYGDAALALVRASGKLTNIVEIVQGEGDNREAECEIQRAGEETPRVFKFSVADAKRAKLWGKQGPWTEYPDRMLTFRARSWALRDLFGDVLCGLGIAEEVADYPRQASIEASTEQVALPEAKPAPTVELAGPVTQETLKAIAEQKPRWLETSGVGAGQPEASWAWKRALEPFGVTSATKLTEEQGQQFLATLRVSKAEPVDMTPQAEAETGKAPETLEESP